MITVRYANLDELLSFIRSEDHIRHFRSVLMKQQSETRNGSKVRETYLSVQALSIVNGQSILHSYFEAAGSQIIGNDLEVQNYDDWKAGLVSKLTSFEDQMRDVTNWTEAFIAPDGWAFSFLSWKEMSKTGEDLKEDMDRTPFTIDDRELTPQRPATGEVPAFQPDGVVAVKVSPTGRSKNPVHEK